MTNDIKKKLDTLATLMLELEDTQPDLLAFMTAIQLTRLTKCKYVSETREEILAIADQGFSDPEFIARALQEFGFLDKF